MNNACLVTKSYCLPCIPGTTMATGMQYLVCQPRLFENINEIILALTILLIPQPYKPNLLSLNFYIFYVLFRPDGLVPTAMKYRPLALYRKYTVCCFFQTKYLVFMHNALYSIQNHFNNVWNILIL
jgi:hypothetical protein